MKTTVYVFCILLAGFANTFAQESRLAQNSALPNVTVRVLDKESFEPIDAKILIVGAKADKQIVPVFEDRMYKYRVPVGDTTTFSIYAEGYETLNEAVPTGEINGTEVFYLTPKSAGVGESSSNIETKSFRDLPKPVLREDITTVLYFSQSTTNMIGRSRRELERIVDFLSKNENLQIDLAGHTDSIGDSEKNMQLSRDRASAIRQHLVTNSVNPERIKSKGFGATQPVAGNDSERTRKFNRRVVIKLVRF